MNRSIQEAFIEFLFSGFNFAASFVDLLIVLMSSGKSVTSRVFNHFKSQVLKIPK